LFKDTTTQETSKTEFIAVSAFLLYFAVKAFYFAFFIGTNIFPDEISWFGISEVFSRSFLPPADSLETYQFGLVTRVPNLYFYLMGKVMLLNVFPVSDLVFLRCANVFISILTVWFSWKLIRLLVFQTAARLLFIVMVTNTIMFTFVSASVSYDNLTNCFAVLALYCLISFFQFRQSHYSLLFFLFASMGMLTKITFLPYAITLMVVFLFHEHNNFGSLPSAVVSLFSPFRKKNYVLLVLCLFFISANGNLYLGNLIRYGSLQPDTIELIGLENAMQYRLFARGYIVNLFMDGKISYSEAQKMAFKYIRHTGDLADTFSLLGRAAREKASKQKPRIDRFRYVFSWVDLMMARTFNIAGHKVMYKSGNEMLPYVFLLLISVVLMVRRMRASDLEGSTGHLLFIAGLYALILMQLVNYRVYLIHGSIGLGLTGRYIFPVLVPIYALAAHYLAGFGAKWLRFVISLTVTAIFVYGEFPWFLQKVTPDWFFK
jgi:hypothetical protein